MTEPLVDKTIAVAQRTRKNLEYFDAQNKSGLDVYEFTQLFNSMLGMSHLCSRRIFQRKSSYVD